MSFLSALNKSFLNYLYDVCDLKIWTVEHYDKDKDNIAGYWSFLKRNDEKGYISQIHYNIDPDTQYLYIRWNKLIDITPILALYFIFILNTSSIKRICSFPLSEYRNKSFMYPEKMRSNISCYLCGLSNKCILCSHKNKSQLVNLIGNMYNDLENSQEFIALKNYLIPETYFPTHFIRNKFKTSSQEILSPETNSISGYISSIKYAVNDKYLYIVIGSFDISIEMILLHLMSVYSYKTCILLINNDIPNFLYEIGYCVSNNTEFYKDYNEIALFKIYPNYLDSILSADIEKITPYLEKRWKDLPS